MPTCVLCRTNLKTRGNLACHHRLLHGGKSVGFGHVPEVTLLYFVNSVKQTLTCPVDYCSFKRNNCKDVQPIANHFTRCHPHHQLFVTYHIQWCNLYIDPAERPEHNWAHIQHLRGGPFSPPTPVIDPKDHSLTYTQSPVDTEADSDSAMVKHPPPPSPCPDVASPSLEYDSSTNVDAVNVSLFASSSLLALPSSTVQPLELADRDKISWTMQISTRRLQCILSLQHSYSLHLVARQAPLPLHQYCSLLLQPLKLLIQWIILKILWLVTI